MPAISPCLWFDDQAEAAANFYVGIFKNAKIERITRYPNAGQDIHGRPAGSVMTVEFELDGQKYTALNGGPVFQFNEAISLQVICKSQDEIDYFWEKLTAGGGQPGQCGWLKDKFGVSWQVAPRMPDFSDAAKAERGMKAMLGMTKIDMPALIKAYEGR